MKALVLAAGYGTRLYPLVQNTAKPLLPVGNRPLIDYILDEIHAIPDLREVLVVTNNKFCGDFEKWAAAKKDFSAPIQVINDGTNSPDDRLGAVGDIHFVLKNYPPGDDLLVVGGDNLFDFDLKGFITFAKVKVPAVSIGVYDIAGREDARKFGVVEMAADGRIRCFEEKPQQPKSSLIAMCFYYFPQPSFALMKKYIQESHMTDKAGDYIHWLTEQGPVYAFPFCGNWYDIGSIETYKEVQEKFKKM